MVTSNPARVVLIEDNPTDVMLLRLALESGGGEYSFEVLEDGERALEFLRQHVSHPSLPEPCVLVIDLHLPKFDGITVLRAIKEQPTLAHLRVVVLTGLASDSERIELARLGVRLCRAKPGGWEEFLTLASDIRDICDNHTFKANA